METIIAKVKEAIDTGVPFDLELLLDDLVVASKTLTTEHKEELHQQGRSFQQFYDSIINQLKEAVASELLYLRNAPVSESTQHSYKSLKLILNILEGVPTVF